MICVFGSFLAKLYFSISINLFNCLLRVRVHARIALYIKNMILISANFSTGNRGIDTEIKSWTAGIDTGFW